MKTIKVTHIDTGGHGYLSVSKKDFLLVCGVHEITGYSGHNYSRIYLEEDQDASTFMNKAQSLDIKVDVKSGYNLNFKITHNYKPDLFVYTPQLGDLIESHGRDYVVTDVKEDLTAIIKDVLTGQRFKIPSSNPFEYITGLKKREG